MFRKIKQKILRHRDVKALYRDWRSISLIKKSDFFDADWYLETYPDVKAANLDPALHFIRYGTNEGRDPSSRFSTIAYLSAYKDVATSGMNPLLHFIRYGLSENRDPKPNINVVKDSVINPEKPTQLNVFERSNYVAIFAFFNEEGKVLPYVEYYLSALSQHATIIFVSDNYLPDEEINKVKPFIHAAICQRHGEYDFGSYKRGIQYARENGLLVNNQALILCNDSCIGPLHDISHTFDVMNKRKADFWGITSNAFMKPHLQTYFLFFNRQVFDSPVFINFFNSIEKKNTVKDVVISYEIPLTGLLSSNGFKWSSYITATPFKPNPIQKKTEGPEIRPLFMLQNGSPFIKRKSLLKSHCNIDGIDSTIIAIKNKNYELYRHCMIEPNIMKYTNSSNISFSLIMPTFNRGYCIADAIDSVLQQTHNCFELIIVDDGSTDNTSELISDRYREELSLGKIRYFKNSELKGVCGARNTGLKKSQNDWIAYVDTDNQIRPHFLKTFAQAIIEHDAVKSFYSEFCRRQDGFVVGTYFDEQKLSQGNYIDLGVYVHHRSCFEKLGGFDTELKRLVDWDLILRYSRENPPHYVRNILMDYNNDENPNRISRKESGIKARIAIIKKHKLRPTVTVAIPCYNQENFIAEAIDSAISQRGDFETEILISDDGSTDGTRDVIEHYLSKYPMKIRSIGDGINRGISGNFRRCFHEASGEYLAVLEGDDYWPDSTKIMRQIEFLQNNPDASMVFTKTLVRNVVSGTERTLTRQDNLCAELLTGHDFLADSSMNLIANFSSCMFRSKLCKELPDKLFESRFNEIALAFHLERLGNIGFIPDIMNLYRQHPKGVWTGSDPKKQLESAIHTRLMVKEVADPIYHDAIQRVIDQKQSELSSLTGS